MGKLMTLFEIGDFLYEVLAPSEANAPGFNDHPEGHTEANGESSNVEVSHSAESNSGDSGGDISWAGSDDIGSGDDGTA